MCARLSVQECCIHLRLVALYYGWVPHIMAGFLILWFGSSYILWLGSSYYGWVPHIMAWFLILWLGSSYWCTSICTSKCISHAKHGSNKKCKTITHTTVWVGLLYRYLPNCITHSIFCSYRPTGHHIFHIFICYNYPSQLAHSPLWFGRHSGIYSVLDRAGRTG